MALIPPRLADQKPDQKKHPLAYRLFTIEEHIANGSNLYLYESKYVTYAATWLDFHNNNYGTWEKGNFIIFNSKCITSNPAPFLESAYVITEEEYNKQNKYAQPDNELKSMFGQFLCLYNWKCDNKGGYYYVDAQNNIRRLNEKFITLKNAQIAPLNTTLNNVYGETISNSSYSIPAEKMKVVPATPNPIQDFKLSMEEEIKININNDHYYVLKKDIAGYKAGEIINAHRTDMLTGDPLIIDLNTGKEVKVDYYSIESKSRKDILKLRQDN